MSGKYLKVRAVSPATVSGEPERNAEILIDELKIARERGVDAVVFPELALSGATAGDLFFRDDFLAACEAAAERVTEAARELSVSAVFGYPLWDELGTYDAIELAGDREAHFVSVRNTGGQGFRDLKRWFKKGVESSPIDLDEGIKAGLLPFKDLDRADKLVAGGCKILFVPAAEAEIAGSDAKRKEMLLKLSARYGIAVVYQNAGAGESVTDNLFAGGALIASCGKVLSEQPILCAGAAEAEIDLDELFDSSSKSVTMDTNIEASANQDLWDPAEKSSKFVRFPFIASDFVAQATKMFEIQTEALRRRLDFIGGARAVVGVSGGLDSTLALLVAASAARRSGREPKSVLAVTMPGGGTSGRTYENAKKLMRLLGVEAREIPIADACKAHLKDLNHTGQPDVAYENAQARERTQILMDLSNMVNGIVVGTGDLSELATGFATYNGDHMSMYGVNGSVSKTLMRKAVGVIAEKAGGELKEVLLDIVKTPVSPELKPVRDGETEQFSESVVGPYELVDFFLYYFWFVKMLPEEVIAGAKEVFGERYTENALKDYFNGFIGRFFRNQFKRSCLPDGIDATGFSLSPRGSLVLPSDRNGDLFLV